MGEKARDILLASAAGVLGLLIAWRDIRATGDDAPMTTLALLYALGAVFGGIQPARPWRWAVALGISLPLAHLIVRALGFDDHFQPDPYAARLILIPVALLAASAGAYAGAGVRWLLRSALREA